MYRPSLLLQQQKITTYPKIQDIQPTKLETLFNSLENTIKQYITEDEWIVIVNKLENLSQDTLIQLLKVLIKNPQFIFTKENIITTPQNQCIELFEKNTCKINVENTFKIQINEPENKSITPLYILPNKQTNHNIQLSKHGIFPPTQPIYKISFTSQANNNPTPTNINKEIINNIVEYFKDFPINELNILDTTASTGINAINSIYNFNNITNNNINHIKIEAAENEPIDYQALLENIILYNYQEYITPIKNNLTNTLETQTENNVIYIEQNEDINIISTIKKLTENKNKYKNLQLIVLKTTNYNLNEDNWWKTLQEKNCTKTINYDIQGTNTTYIFIEINKYRGIKPTIQNIIQTPENTYIIENFIYDKNINIPYYSQINQCFKYNQNLANLLINFYKTGWVNVHYIQGCNENITLNAQFTPQLQQQKDTHIRLYLFPKIKNKQDYNQFINKLLILLDGTFKFKLRFMNKKLIKQTRIQTIIIDLENQLQITNFIQLLKINIKNMLTNDFIPIENLNYINDLGEKIAIATLQDINIFNTQYQQNIQELLLPKSIPKQTTCKTKLIETEIQRKYLYENIIKNIQKLKLIQQTTNKQISYKQITSILIRYLFLKNIIKTNIDDPIFITTTSQLAKQQIKLDFEYLNIINMEPNQFYNILENEFIQAYNQLKNIKINYDETPTIETANNKITKIIYKNIIFQDIQNLIYYNKEFIHHALALNIRYNYLNLSTQGLANNYQQIYKSKTNVTEAFASAFNHYFDIYYSAFPDLEYVFGSRGSIFQQNFEDLETQIIECNPPFDITLIQHLIQKIKIHIEETTKQKIKFILTLPAWKDNKDIMQLKTYKYTTKFEITQKENTHFIDHMNNQNIIKPCDIINITIEKDT